MMMAVTMGKSKTIQQREGSDDHAIEQLALAWS
jgi:hypothetical protein